jgi:hypothetical protein
MADDLVMVRVFDNEVEAEIARGELEAAGIRAVVLKDDAGGMYPFLQGASGVRLMVAPDDTDRAEDILESGSD